MAGTNKMLSNADRIKSGDNGSIITLTLSNLEEATVNAIEHVRLTIDYLQYVDVPQFELVGDKLEIKLPDVPKGKYIVEVKDDVGRIYSSDASIFINVIESTEGAKKDVFITYKEEIIGELSVIVGAHMTANAELYKGDPGDTVSNPPKTYTRAEYDALSTYDDNTLYIVKEA